VTILGFDTSMAPTSACVLLDDGRSFTSEKPSAERILGPPAHSAELLPAVARLLEEAGLGWSDLRALAVGVGPGTFTGLRIGVATARGLAQALGLGVRPVPSLDALAAGMATAAEPGRPLLPLIDARRRQVFAGLYRAGARLEREWGPVALDRGELLERLAMQGESPLAAGDWALESRSDLEAAGVAVPSSDSGLHAVNALHICRLAGDVDPLSPNQVTPIYVRLPDAEINKRTQ
jgi:tRNA threonylcarbamoyladenosine biosynthesis protein TsaB